jgi:sugar phosphate isomerase/epimerase
MLLSCCAWALTGPEEHIIEELAACGFEWLDIRPGMFKTPAAISTLQQRRVGLSCIALSAGMPDAGLDAPDADDALEHCRRALATAETAGIRHAYLVPGYDPSPPALERYAQRLRQVAANAALHRISLSLEHFPGRALPTVDATLDFIGTVGHDNLYLLFDLGHAVWADEDAPACIAQAGRRLGYVHLDDNDGNNDLHWGLLDGVLDHEQLDSTFAALKTIGYDGPVSLELSSALDQPLEALHRSRRILRQWI